MKRKLLTRSLDIVGITLLVAAAVLAWQTYFPPAEPLPPDITVITKDTPADVFPDAPTAPTQTRAVSEPTSPAQTTSAASTVAPPAAVLPGRVTTPDPISSSASDAARRPSARQNDYNWLEPFRAQAFPDAAQALPDRLIIPSINVDSGIKEVGWKQTEENGQSVTEWDVVDYAVGFHQNSALPGAKGNTVMSGHNNFKGQVFRNLSDVKIGDEIFLFAAEQVFRYVVTQKLLVQEKDVTLEERLKNAAWINPTRDVRLTLVSCWPYATNTHRIIVVAKPAPPQ